MVDARGRGRRDDEAGSSLGPDRGRTDAGGPRRLRPGGAPPGQGRGGARCRWCWTGLPSTAWPPGCRELSRRLSEAEGRLARLAEAAGVDARRLHHQLYRRGEPQRAGSPACRRRRAPAGRGCAAASSDQVAAIVAEIERASRRRRPEARRLPRPHGRSAARQPRRRARQGRDGARQSAPRHLDRAAPRQSRPAAHRPHPGRQYRPDARGREVRLAPRLQVLDLCHLVDPPGLLARAGRPGPAHPHPLAHDRRGAPGDAHGAPARQRAAPRPDRGASWPTGSACRWPRCAPCSSWCASP